jgi:hypothetical protein
MAGPKALVAPPSFIPREFGLLSVVQTRYEETDPHWRNGVIWEANCGLGGITCNQCDEDFTVVPKADNIEVQQRGATPFTPFAEVDCPPVGYSPEEQAQRALAALARIESYQVERTFWTGSTCASGIVYPHLAADAEVFDSGSYFLGNVLLQTAASVVTGATLDVVEAFGRLEGALARCANGAGILHITPEVADEAAAWSLIAPRNGQMRTALGNLVAVGAGYTGSSPAGVLTDGVHWAYATSPVFAYRSPSERVGTTIAETLDRDVNTVKTIAERTYVLGFDCCHIAVPISLGGESAGLFNSAA